MPRVLLAPDKFKGSASAAEVAEHLRRGLLRGRPGLQVLSLPMADGGDGTVAAVLAAGYGERLARVHGPLDAGPDRVAVFALSEDGRTAVVEMALASGLALTAATDASARGASSRGTGDLIRAALDAGAKRIVVGAGGSACTDGGAGMLAALGARLLDQRGDAVAAGGDALRTLAAVDLAGLDPRLTDVEIVLASDVDNPLLGPAGAAAVYAPQKGADAAAVTELEVGLRTWVQRLDEAGVAGAIQGADRLGAGAAGGLGYGLLVVLGARLRPGVEVVMGLTDFASAVAGAALVITGEGSLDEQSLRGKTPIGVAAAARAAGVPVLAVAGRSSLTDAQLRAHGLTAQHVLTDLEPDVETCVREAGRLLEDVGERIARELA